MAILRIVTTDASNAEIVSSMQSENYGITQIDATGSRGNFKMILSLVNRTDVPWITQHIQATNPRAFFSIEEVQYVNQGIFRPKNPTISPGFSIFSSVPVRKNDCAFIR